MTPLYRRLSQYMPFPYDDEEDMYSSMGEAQAFPVHSRQEVLQMFPGVIPPKAGAPLGPGMSPELDYLTTIYEHLQDPRLKARAHRYQHNALRSRLEAQGQMQRRSMSNYEKTFNEILKEQQSGANLNKDEILRNLDAERLKRLKALLDALQMQRE